MLFDHAGDGDAAQHSTTANPPNSLQSAHHESPPHEPARHDRSATILVRADSSSGLSSSSLDSDESAQDDSSVMTSPPRMTQRSRTAGMAPSTPASPFAERGLQAGLGAEFGQQSSAPVLATHAGRSAQPTTSSRLTVDASREPEDVRGETARCSGGQTCDSSPFCLHRKLWQDLSIYSNLKFMYCSEHFCV